MPLFEYEGFFVHLTGGIKVDASIKLAYDTYGLRQFVGDAFNNKPVNGLDLFNGLYVSADSHLHIGGFVGLEGGVDYTLLKAFVDGKITATVNVDIPNSQDTDGDGKIRPFEFDSCFFQIKGALEGYLGLHFQEGVDPFALHQDITLAQGTIADFNIGCTNPFDAGSSVHLATWDAGTGVLTLNMGVDAGARNYKPDEKNENYLITHAEPAPGDPKTGEAVYVTAFGFTQRFAGVKKIYAKNAFDGNDVVFVDEHVGAAVELHGGAGADTLQAMGTGPAKLYGDNDDDTLVIGKAKGTIDGGAGNDVLQAGEGSASLIGGAGNDTITGGAGTNYIYGDSGNDRLIGGTGQNFIDAGEGDDYLLAGPLNDTLDGKGGNDTIEAGIGYNILLGGTGNDNFIWHGADPGAKLEKGDGGAEINGGGGIDTLTAFGGSNSDIFVLGKTYGNPKYDVQLYAPGDGPNGFVNLLFTQISLIDIEAEEAADQIFINDLTSTHIVQVGVNLNDLVKNNYGFGDKAKDLVIINATQEADNVTVQAELKVIQVPNGHGEEPVKGGVTTFTGLPRYKILVANVDDDVRFNALGGNDTINVLGITGPTIIHGDGGLEPAGSDDDTFNVTAKTAMDYATELNIEADRGANALHVFEPSNISDSYVMTQDRIESSLLHAVNFHAKNGDFSQGVSLSTGGGNDFVKIRSTLPGVNTLVQTNGADDIIEVGSNDGTMGNLASILGSLTVDVGAGVNNYLMLNDYAATAGNQNVNVTFNQVLGFAGPTDTTPINYFAMGGKIHLGLFGSNNESLQERFLLNAPNAITTVYGNAGNDVFYVPTLSQAATINGGQGDDVAIAGYSVNKLDALFGALTFNGDSGNDTFNLIDTQALVGQTYKVLSDNVQRAGIAPISFDATVETLNLAATTFGDQVTVQTIPVVGLLNLLGGAGSNQLTGPNGDIAWLVQTDDDGLLGSKVKFDSFQTLHGGSGKDRFVLSNGVGVSTMIDGGSGADVIDQAAYTSSMFVNLQTKNATKIPFFQSIEEFVGGAAASTLVGSDTPNLWQIRALDAGNVNQIAFGTVVFSSFENLEGGLSTDTFQFGVGGYLSGRINGNAGVNTLDYSPLTTTMPVEVDLQAGKATRVGFGALNIGDVIGGAGDDLIFGNAKENHLYGGNGNDILVGRDGDDQLEGGSGRNLLIGGFGVDVLLGGAGQDILIGNATIYDSNKDALTSIMKEWSSAPAMTVRRQHLLNQVSGGQNNGYFLTNNEMKEDSVTDQITGSGETDWFWGNVAEFLDFQPGDKWNAF